MDHLWGKLKIHPVIFPNIKIKRFPEKFGLLTNILLFTIFSWRRVLVNGVTKISLISSAIHLLLSWHPIAGLYAGYHRFADCCNAAPLNQTGLSCQITWRLGDACLYIETSRWPWSPLISPLSLSWEIPQEYITLSPPPPHLHFHPFTFSVFVSFLKNKNIKHILSRNPPASHGSLSPWS